MSVLRYLKRTHAVYFFVLKYTTSHGCNMLNIKGKVLLNQPQLHE